MYLVPLASFRFLGVVSGIVSFVLIFGYNPNALEIIPITNIITITATIAPRFMSVIESAHY